MVPNEGIQQLSERIVREFHPERIILFGSYAYGIPTNDSDVDILVILPFDGKPIHKALEIIKKINRTFHSTCSSAHPKISRSALPTMMSSCLKLL